MSSCYDIFLNAMDVEMLYGFCQSPLHFARFWVGHCQILEVLPVLVNLMIGSRWAGTIGILVEESTWCDTEGC